ncbi:winged helix-turn-helix transcriptional regulator [Coralliovum pocilloporae]|uniref:winged helix-turn-helix transcriptional regulator n=1 Tax=Coralliovum pocilloporae TaxID=3066369 RepID=UPI00330730F1
MKHTSYADMSCSIAQALEAIGPWWAFLIIRDAFLGIRRFSDFERSLGIAKTTLTSRLRLLVEAGVMEKVPDSAGSKYHEYQLTEKGADLLPVLVALSQWGEQWTGTTHDEAIVVVDTATGTQIPRQIIRDETGAPIPLDRLTYLPRSELAEPSSSD